MVHAVKRGTKRAASDRTTPALKAIALDLDGVIIESLDIKTQAFAEMFRHYPEHRDAIIDLHLQNLGISRYEKFKTIYRDLLDQPISDRELQRLGVQFSGLIFDRIVQCPFVDGALEFLRKRSNAYKLFVASGTPEEELHEIVRVRGLTSLFTGVFGSPRGKHEILRAIMHDEHLVPEEVLFVGDALTDYVGALGARVYFVGRVPEGVENPFSGDVVTVRSLSELDRRWTEVVAQLTAGRTESA